MTVYMGAILLTELLMLSMSLHVLHYPGFKPVEKRWYVCAFIAIFFCAGAEYLARALDARGPAFRVPLTVLTVMQFSLSPMLPAFFAGALGVRRGATVVGTFFCVHILAEIVCAPFGWIFCFDAAGRYIRGPYYVIYEAFYILSLVFLIVCLIVVSRRFRRRDRITICMVFVLVVAALVPLILFKVYTDYVGIGMCAALCYIYYNDLVQEDTRGKIIANQQRMFQMQNKTISGMANLIESREIETGEHVTHTSQCARALAECARWDGVYADKLDDTFISMLYMLTPMHDIGKIVVSDSILKKPDKLSEAEYDEVRHHADRGGEIVRQVLSGVADEAYVAMASDIATYHHERWDGTGYPAGLAGEDIPLSARIMAIVDVYDTLISERCYKRPVSKEEAFEIIRQEAGTHFDPRLARVLLDHREAF